ncbi:Acetyl-coenzyme A synthetase, partial [Nosema granulosis]
MEKYSDEEKQYDYLAKDYLDWDKVYDKVTSGDEFFIGGKLNACYNAVDRHCKVNSSKIAFVKIDESGNVKKITYNELQTDVIKMATFFRERNISADDVVTIYGSNNYEIYCAILACTRLGIVINLVFGGYSSEILASRVQESGSKMIVTMNKVVRRNKNIDYISNVLDCVERSLHVLDVLVFGKSDIKSGDFLFFWDDYKNESYSQL